MHCATCETEYRAGIEVCADCGEKLLDGPPRSDAPVSNDGAASMDEVFRTADPLEAELVAATLRESGIESMVKMAFHGGLALTPMETHWAPGQQRVVLVPSIASERARAVVREIASEDLAVKEGPVSDEPIVPGAPRAVPSAAKWVSLVFLGFVFLGFVFLWLLRAVAGILRS